MAEKQATGLLALAEARDLVARREIDSVWVVTPDLYGRPVGKRLGGRYFIDEVADREMRLSAHRFLRGLGNEMVSPPGSGRLGPGDTLVCRIDGGSLRRAPWLDRTAVAICDVVVPSSGDPHPLSVRGALRRQLERARSASVSARGAAVMEVYVADESGGMQVADDLQRSLVDSGVRVEHVSPSLGSGQFEIAPGHSPFLEAADRAMLIKWAARSIAGQHGASATFMAQPDGAQPPSSMQIHSSLWSSDREAPLFVSQEANAANAAADDLPVACRWWLGGLVQHLADLALLFAPTPNSFRRYRSDPASSLIGWQRERRGTALRVCGDGARRNVACALAGADANPYLAFAAVLAAGLDGLANRTDPPPPVGGDSSALRTLPRVAASVAEATGLAAQSRFMRQAFGELLVTCLVECAMREAALAGQFVSPWEKDRYSQI